MSDSDRAILRRLVARDLPEALRLSEHAGWNQTIEDWRMLLELAPESCLAIEVDGELAATTTLVSYGSRLAWIGMVLTKASFRGHGFARRLLTQALALADEMQIETVKLDATDQGRPIYEKMGFRCEQVVERWSLPQFGTTSGSTPSIEAPAERWREVDHRAFGVDRFQLLEKLALRSSASMFKADSYLLARSGRQTRYLGPSVCDTPEAARTLFEQALRTADIEGWSWDMLPANASAAGIARELGFAPARHLQRMVRGKDLRGDESMIYAIAGFELG